MLQARLRRLLAIAAGCGFAALPAQNCHDFAAIAPIAQDLLSQFPLQGSSCLRVDQRGSTVYEQAFGSFTLQEVVPIASASKTLSAVVLMSLCDSGVVSLDDRVGLYLPEWNTGLRAQITLRMCFTHTAGLPGNHPAIGDNSITLRAAAQQLATVPLGSRMAECRCTWPARSAKWPAARAGRSCSPSAWRRRCSSPRPTTSPSG
jgi:CubicO group peptidase (beta-lactamase class C family)